MHSGADNMERQKRLNRIRRVSGVMKWFITVLIGLLVIIAVLVGGMFFAPEFAGMTNNDGSEFSQTMQEIGAETVDFGEVERPITDIPFWQRLGLSVMISVAIATLMVALWQIRQLFVSFSQSDFFSPIALSRMLSLGWWLVAFAIYDIVSDMIGSVLLTLDYPVGERQIAIEIEGAELFFIIFGVIMILFGWIMREAANIAEENKQFV
ncbi:DUF2975 domain-containing protein [Roseibium sp.]|uniref:DUF2975 domain-containing protein n=1 Tax=Roseibium sp. TaxID=1936156 RepID=UPI003B52E946